MQVILAYKSTLITLHNNLIRGFSLGAILEFILKLCKHKQRVIVRISKSPSNQGKLYGACPNSPKGDHTTILDASTLYQMRRIEDMKKLNAKLVEKA